jgi:hypothetical protein
MELKKTLMHRTLHWSSKQLVVQISVPRRERRRPDWPSDRQPDWYCCVDLKLVPGKRVDHARAFGIDGWQAVEGAMWHVKGVVEQRYPDAYLFEPGGGPFFALMFSGDFMGEFRDKLRKHLEREHSRMVAILYKEIKKRKSQR